MIRISTSGHNLALLLIRAQKQFEKHGSQVGGPPSSSDDVDISDGGNSYLDSIRYTSSFPTRDGMPVDALLLAIRHPEATSSSRGKTFAVVAEDARKELDAAYDAMKNSGLPFDKKTPADVHALFGRLDRRSLYAVSVNKDGRFTADEIQAAQDIMQKQQLLALSDTKSEGLESLHRALTFLDNVSPEEKTSPEWLAQMTKLNKLSMSAHSAAGTESGKPSFYVPTLAELLS